MFKNILLDLMNERFINQRQLSIAANIPPTTINGWLKANRLPDYYALIKLSRFFDVSTDYLLGIADNEETSHFSHLSNLTKSEETLIEDFRSLTPALQQMLQATIQTWKKSNVNSNQNLGAPYGKRTK